MVNFVLVGLVWFGVCLLVLSCYDAVPGRVGYGFRF